MDTAAVDAPGLGATFPLNSRPARLIGIVRQVRFWLVASVTASLALTACGGGGSSPAPPATYSVIATVSGLAGSGLVLSVGNGTNVNISGNGAVTLTTGLSSGSSYTVTIDTQPINPVQTCNLTAGSGNVTNANADVTVTCVAGTATTVNMVPANVTIDSSVPATVTAMITSIVSSIDSQAPGNSVLVPVSFVGGEAMVLATDANDNIVLASLSTGNSVKLTINSTALALTRLAMGTLPPSATASQVNAAIEATAEFPNLESLISSALATNMPLTTSSAVYLSISTVLSQLPAAVLTSLQQAKLMTVHSQAEPVASPSVTTNLPYTLINFSTKLPQIVAVTGTTVGGDLQVSNTTLIAWSIASETTSGDLLCLPTAGPSNVNMDCSVTVPQTDILHQLESIISSSAVSTAIVEGAETNGGGGFNITLEQNAVSRTANVSVVFKDVATTLIGFAIAEAPAATQCLSSAIDMALPPSEVATLVLSPSGATVAAYLEGVFSKTSLVKTFFGCAQYVVPAAGKASGSSSFASALAAFAFGFAKFGFDVISPAATIVGIPGEIYFTVNYWSFNSQLFGVCEAKPPSSNYIISNCANSFTFTPAPLIMVPNDIFTPTLAAYVGANGTGSQTLTPPDLTYTSAQDETVIKLDANTGAVTALTMTPGQTSAQATVTVTENSTGLTADYLVTVNSQPLVTVTASPASLPATGGMVTITATLAPPAGDNVNSPNPTQTVQFVDGSGLTRCPAAQITSGVATCSFELASAPSTITTNYGGDANYASNSGSVVVGSDSIATTFTYTGNVFNAVNFCNLPPYPACPTGPVTASVTFNIPPNFTGTISGANNFTFTLNAVGDTTLSSVVGTVENAAFTFANGAIVSWALAVYSGDFCAQYPAGVAAPNDIATYNQPGNVRDYAINCGGQMYVSNDPGVWVLVNTGP